jgi:hypothetical protein
VIAAPRDLRTSAPFSETTPKHRDPLDKDHPHNAAERIVQSLSCGTAPALMCPPP